jgi:hydroxymethylpyrimidine pyrophosphatase-like HAD family hydrolase
MKLSVLALDYDGTIATDSGVDPAVRAAIADARARHIVVLLVTGRRLDDLRRVAGELHFVDGVVAENGAVIHFPDSGYASVLGSPPAAAFLQELGRRGVSFAAGACVVEADATDACRMLEVIRATEVPLALAFNRGRVMALPQSISKGSGLRKALEVLRLSAHGAVGIGDAENDHDLLQTCEIGVAVGWGSPSLQAVADHVLDGRGPASVAPYLRRLAADRRLPAVRSTRRRLLLGHGDDGQPVEIAVRGRNVLVAGDARSGKSWVTGLLTEQLILRDYSVCVIDPEGDYRPLEALPGVTVLGGVDPLPRPRELLRALRHPDTSVVLDLSHVSHDEKVAYTRSLLFVLATLRRRTGIPQRIVLDEAHYFLHGPGAEAVFDVGVGGFTLVTYRASQLPPELLGRCGVIIVTCESDPSEIEALHVLCNPTDDLGTWTATLSSLGTGEAGVLPVTEEAGGTLRRVHLTNRLTPHVRHREKYVDIAVDEHRAFVFTGSGTANGDRPRTLRDFVAGLERASSDVVEGHTRRGDFSRWIGDVFGDYPLAQTVESLEHRDSYGREYDVGRAIANAIRERYDLSDEGSIEGAVPHQEAL